jgi:hypothetical protein
MKSVKLFIAVFALSTSFSLLSPEKLMAQSRTAVLMDTIGGEPVKFAGLDGDMLLFDVLVDNLPAGINTLSILDENGNLLFEERVNATRLNRRVKFTRDVDVDMITFKISNKTVLVSQSFTVSYKVEEKWEIKKAK